MKRNKTWKEILIVKPAVFESFLERRRSTDRKICTESRVGQIICPGIYMQVLYTFLIWIIFLKNYHIYECLPNKQDDSTNMVHRI